MKSTLSNLMASLNYWTMFGLSLLEAWQRVLLAYGTTAAPFAEQAISLFISMQGAASAINLSPGGIPIPGNQLPCLDTARGVYQYRVNAPIFNPDTNRWSHIVVVVESDQALSTQEIRQAAKDSATRTTEKSPEKFLTGRMKGFKVTGIPLNNYVVLTASLC